MEDLEVCLSIIRRYWTRHRYRIVVVSNGMANGFVIPQSCRQLADHVVELEMNAGHLKGASQLLLAGLETVSQDCEYVVLLEADNWIFTDSVIDKYIERIRKEKAVWASAEWVERHESLAVDFAVVDAGYAKAHPDLFVFSEHAERYVGDYLRSHGHKYLLVAECMPTHIPKLFRIFYNRFGGRNRSFTRAQMVTHHVEDLPGGVEEKKALANRMLGRREYELFCKENLDKEHLKLKLFELFIRIVPRSSWIKAKKT